MAALLGSEGLPLAGDPALAVKGHGYPEVGARYDAFELGERFGRLALGSRLEDGEELFVGQAAFGRFRRPSVLGGGPLERFKDARTFVAACMSARLSRLLPKGAATSDTF